jgi:diguanylate cyclase (GGDEF)-like protein/PAS domain S-box-containing protein
MIKPPKLFVTGLRQRAEVQLKKKPKSNKVTPNEHEEKKMLHELQVHQIELEMQNEEMQQSLRSKHMAINRYSELFEFAPIAYFVIDVSGLINRVNSKGASLLGIERANLIGKNFLNCIDLRGQYRDEFSSCFGAIFKGEGTQSCEVLIDAGKRSVWFNLIVSLSVLDNDCLITVIDITEKKLAEQEIISSEHFAQAVINASSASICVLSKDGYIVKVNQSWRFFYDENDSAPKDSDYYIGTNYIQICEIARGLNSEEASSIAVGIIKVVRGECEEFNQEYACDSPTEQRWFNVHVTPFKDDSGNVVIAHENITQHKLAELREATRSNVLELITSDEPLPVILEAIVRSVEHEKPTLLCSILLLDDEGKRLLVGAAPSLPDFYNEAIHGVEIGVGVGSCGTVAYTNERVIVEDIQSHSYWGAYKELASKAKLTACWSEPIRSKAGGVLGTFAIYNHDVHKPTEADIALIEQVIHLASIAIEKAQVKLLLQSSEQRLRKSEKCYDLAMKGSQDGLWDWNLITSEVIYSPRWKSMLGYAENEIENNLVEGLQRLHPDDKHRVLLHSAKYLKGQTERYSLEFRMQHKDGHYVDILSRAFGAIDETGRITRVVGTHVDITERKKGEEKLRLAASVFTHAAEGITITDAAGTIIDVNDTFTQTTGYSREEAIGQNRRILKSGRQPPEFYDDMWQALLDDGAWSGEVWNRRKNGEVYAEILNISSVKDASGQTRNYVVLSNDITLMKEHQDQLERISRYDILTNLPNRSLLADRLSQAMLQCSRHKQSLAVVFLDLDHFKDVNDTHGHDVGDELLIALSARMKEALREGDTLARIGGDEFVAVLADLVKVEDCEPVLERLLLAASEPVTVSDTVLNISASIGVTLYPQDSVDADQLVRHADQAMYVAKESGKNRYHLFDTVQDEAIKVQRESLEAIRTALDNQQFVLHYQPKVNMRTGTVIGVEALIRWQNPERGLLNPLEFLPVIENHPMSIEIGEWVIDTVLTQISLWQKRGLKLPVSTSINIAAVQLQQPDFTQRLTTLLAAHPDVEPHYLELEVLETSALDDVAHVSAIMNACMALGVKFALDDFGTGYSSLTYLRRLPASLIKIDQSFVRDMLTDPDDLAIVEGVIALAKSFKRDVIAEGVETIEHGTALLQLGCELAQGYGIAKPMPASDVPEWVADWQADGAWKV